MSKPVVFFDIETTGLSRTEDRIVEIYMTKRDPGTGSKVAEDLYYVLDPEHTIGEEAVALHGITQEDVRGKPAFRDVADEVLAYIKGCDLSGYNIIGFDLQFLFEEFHRCGRIFKYMEHRIIDSYVLWVKMEPRTLTGAVKKFLGEEIVDAHKAQADTECQIRVLFAQMKQYGMDLEAVAARTESAKMVDLSGKFSRSTVSPEHPGDGQQAIYNFGKYKGLGVMDVHRTVDPGYLKWMAESSNMPVDSRMFARKFLKMAQAQKAS
jgi:DNA polymerase III subunit epsilon